MSTPLRTIRLAAILLPAALLLHELAYLIGGGGMIAAHHYLEIVIPLGGALAVSLAVAALVLPTLGSSGGGPQLHAPFVLALALIGIFVGQEATEAALMGGGLEGLAASAAVAWLAPPLALLLGALTSALVAWLERTGELLAERRSRGTAGKTWSASPVPTGPAVADLACACLAFGFARRPPPGASATSGF